MPVLVKCPNPACGKSYSMVESQAGRVARCRQCGKRFAVPTPSVGGGRPVPDAKATAQGQATVHPETAPPRSDAIQAAPRPADAGQPTRIGRYQVRALLGGGAFGKVYRAYDPQLDREVALKVPQPGVLDKPGVIERFLREAKAAAGLRHPHIVPVYDAGFDGTHHYIASAFIEGRTLAHMLSDGRFSFERTAQVVRQLAEALAYAHGLGIVHRDVKPANIMVDARGDVHLMDFGLAFRQDVETQLTRDGAFLGTPAYVSPEQAAGRSGKPLPASDQYSLGVVMYEMLCGETPFSGPAEIQIFNHLRTEPKPLRQMNRMMPRDLDTICLKALMKEAKKRYSSCEEMKDDLRRWLEGEPILARRTNQFQRFVRRCRRQPLVTAASLLALASLIGISVVVRLSSSRLTDSAFAQQSAEEEARTARQSEELARDLASREQRKRQDATDREEKALLAARKTTEDSERTRQQQLERERIAAEARKQEETLKRAVEEQKENESYFNSIPEIAKLIELGKKDLARQVLETCVPRLRQWEWHYLKRSVLEPPLEIQVPSGDTVALAFSPDSRSLVWADGEGRMQSWDVSDGKPIWQMMERCRLLVFNPDGKRLSASSYGRLATWDLSAKPFKISWLVKIDPVDPSCIAYSPDGKYLATNGAKRVQVWDARTGNEVTSLKGHSNEPLALSFISDGKQLVLCDYEGYVSLWDTTSWKLLSSIRIEQSGLTPGKLRGVVFSPDGKALAGYTSDGNLQEWYRETGSQAPPKTFQRDLGNSLSYCVGYTPDSKRLIAASNSSVRLWESSTGKLLLAFDDKVGHPMRMGFVAQQAVFSPDGDMLATIVRKSKQSESGRPVDEFVVRIRSTRLSVTKP